MAESKKDKLAQFFRETSAEKFYKAVHNGAEPTDKYIKIVKNLRNKRLSEGVITLLMHYVTRMNTLTEDYANKIADEFIENEINTVKAAMYMTEKESSKFKQWSVNSKK